MAASDEETVRSLVRDNTAVTDISNQAWCNLTKACLNESDSPGDWPVIYSNAPERYKGTYEGTAQEGVLCWHRDVPLGKVRVFLYHVNETPGNRQLFVTFHNVSGARKQIRCRFAAGHISQNAARDGKRSSRLWLLWNDSETADGGYQQARFGWQTLGAGGFYVHRDMFWRYNQGVFTNEHPFYRPPAPPDPKFEPVASGIWEYTWRRDPSDQSSDPDGRLDILIEARAAIRSTAPPAQPALSDIFQPNDGPGGKDPNRGRGAFPTSKIISATFPISSDTTAPRAVYMADNLQPTDSPQSYCDAALSSTDMIYQTYKQNPAVRNHWFLQGNYGALYRVNLQVRNDAPYEMHYGLVANPRAPSDVWGTYVRLFDPVAQGDISAPAQNLPIGATPADEAVFRPAPLCPYATLVMKRNLAASGQSGFAEAVAFRTFGAPGGVGMPAAFWVVPYS